MEIVDYAVFKLDISSNQLENITTDVSDTDFVPYLNDLILSVNSDNSRKFKFQRSSTEVHVKIKDIVNGLDFQDSVLSISNRLLQKEIEAQEKIAHLEREIQKGVIIYVLFENEGVKSFFICKADHLEFLNEENFRKTRGLPTKKKVFKAFNGAIGEDASVTSILVFDTNATMSKYWWQDFLELEKVYDDAYNTSTALDAIDTRVFRKIKKRYPADHTYLRKNIRTFTNSIVAESDSFVFIA